MPKFSPTKPFSLSEPGEHYANPGKYTSFLRDVIEVMFQIGGVYCYVYRLKGSFDQKRDELNAYQGDDKTPREAGADVESVLSIQDPILNEVRDREYDIDVVPVIKGAYQLSDSEMELLRIGFKSNETISMEFHQGQVEKALGRRFIIGDVIELPHLREVGADGRAANRWYEVKSLTWTPAGYDPMYQRHVVGVILQPIRHQQEFLDLFNNVKDEQGKTLAEQSSNEKHLMGIAKALQDKAAEQCPLTGVDTNLMWFDPDSPEKLPVLWSSNDRRPNDEPVQEGIEFPPNPYDGMWFLNTAMNPNKLYQHYGGKWKMRATDRKREWQPYNWTETLRSHMSDGSEKDKNRGYELVSIHDVLTDRESRSDPSNEED